MRLAEFDRYTDSNVANKGENTGTQWIKHTLASHNNCCYCPFECFHTCSQKKHLTAGSSVAVLPTILSVPNTLHLLSLFLICLFPVLCFIYSTLFNNISFCSLSSGSLKWCPRAQSGPLHYNCINWSLQMISVWQCAAFCVVYFNVVSLCLHSYFCFIKGLLTYWHCGKERSKIQLFLDTHTYFHYAIHNFKANFKRTPLSTYAKIKGYFTPKSDTSSCPLACVSIHEYRELCRVFGDTSFRDVFSLM